MNAYEKLVEKLGEEGARQVMRERRAKVKKPYHYFATLEKDKLKELSSEAGKKRWNTKTSNQ